MKKILITIALQFAVMALIAQTTATFEDVSTKKTKGNLDGYIAKNGQLFKVGDIITLGNPVNGGDFQFVFQFTGLSYEPVFNNAINHQVQIKRIKATKKKAFLYTTKPDGYVYGLMINTELAISQGELQTSILSSDQALEELKKWKDKLDLELINQVEYDSKKAELLKYIK